MTNETKNNFHNHGPLTIEALNNLQNKGYKYLQVKGFTLDHHPEYVEPHYIMLVPIKELSKNPANMGIYEHIDSDMIKDWASTSSTSENLEILLVKAD
ncbi:MAG: hypothetical protein WAU23_09540 [Ferruginibacter sp.]